MSGFLQKPGGDSESAVNSVNAKVGTVVLDTDDISEGLVNKYYEDSLVDNRIDEQKGEPNGLATLDVGGKIPASQLTTTVLVYKGTWNANTNSPTLADGVGSVGDVYIVSEDGTQNLGSGSISFVVGDWVLYNGTIWQKSGGSDGVLSINGQQGTVVLDTDDIAEGSTNKYFDGVDTDSTISGDGKTTPLTVNGINNSNYVIRVKARTTANLTTYTYDNGVDGVGATLTRTTNGPLANLDGIVINEGDIVLIANQTSQITNGIWVLTQKGVTGVSPTIFTRSALADTTAKLNNQVVVVSQGSTQGGNVFRQTTANPVIGTSNIAYTDITGTSVRQENTGTQAVNQIPLYSATLRVLTRGVANFKYNPITNILTVRGLDYLFPATHSAGILTNDGAGNISTQTLSAILGYTAENAANKNTSTSLGTSDVAYPSQNAVKTYVDTGLATKQDTLVSGTNIKTVNGQSLLGGGNILVSGVATVTRGAPTQSAFATGQLQFNSVAYTEVKDTEFTVGTLGSGGKKYKFYDSRVSSAPASPTIGLNIASLYNTASILLGKQANRFGITYENPISSPPLTPGDTGNQTIFEIEDTGESFNFITANGSPSSTYQIFFENLTTEGEDILTNENFLSLFNNDNPNYTVGISSFQNLGSLYKVQVTNATGTTSYNDFLSGDIGFQPYFVLKYDEDNSILYILSYNGSTAPVNGEILTSQSETFSCEVVSVETKDYFSLLVNGNQFFGDSLLGDEIKIFRRINTGFGFNTFVMFENNTVDLANVYGNSGWIEPTIGNKMLFNLSSDNSLVYGFDITGTLLPSDTYLTNGKTITLGTKTYTFQDTLTNVDGNVKVGSDDTETLQNLKDAINLTGTPGGQYANAMTIHPTLSASNASSTILSLLAKTVGTVGNGITCSTDIVAGVYFFDNSSNSRTETFGGTSPSSGSQLISGVNLSSYYPDFARYNSTIIRGSASGNNVNLLYTIPGADGNNIQLQSSNTTAVNISGITFGNGNNSGTPGILGEYRLGYIVEGGSAEQTFLCVGTGVWKNLSNLFNPYTWTPS